MANSILQVDMMTPDISIITNNTMLKPLQRVYPLMIMGSNSMAAGKECKALLVWARALDQLQCHPSDNELEDPPRHHTSPMPLALL